MVKIAPILSRASAFLELTKPRIVLLVLVTVAAGFYLGVIGQVSGVLLFHTLVGTALVAGGTNALNQVGESRFDGLMHRTRRRPIPSGRLSRLSAGAFAWTAGVSGVVYLAAFVNSLATVLAAATLLSYVFLYTPLKRVTSLSTLLGAVPGALPILGGWAAARGSVTVEAWILFAILLLWQLPHFLALAWIYREDYARAGFKVLSIEPGGAEATFRQATLYAAALLWVALAPTFVGMAGLAYFLGGFVLSAWLLWVAFAAARAPTTERARRLFKASVLHLPAVLILLMWDKI